MNCQLSGLPSTWPSPRSSASGSETAMPESWNCSQLPLRPVHRRRQPDSTNEIPMSDNNSDASEHRVTPSGYRLAGWLAMLNALLTIPWFIMTFVLASKEGEWPKIADAIMQIASTAIFVYTSLALRRL